MANARDEILDWAAQGRNAPGRLREAMEAGAALPMADQWRGFLDRVFLFMGAVLLGAGGIFFFAFNWQELGRYAKFALVQAPIVAALATVWVLGVDCLAGKAALLGAALLGAALVVGALLALIGQTYQTGADTCVVYRRLAVDLHVLAGAVLSVVVVVTTFLGNAMRFNDAGVFLFLGLVVIGLSGAGGWWLREVAGEEAGS